MKSYYSIFFKIILYTFFSIHFCLIIFAESIPTDWTGIHENGVGGAFTATSNDESSVFANPSGLSATRNPAAKRVIHSLKFPDLEIGGNAQMLSNMHANPNDWGTDLIQSAKNNSGNQSYFLLQSFNEIIFGKKNSMTFLVGIPIRSENKMVFNDSANPTNAYTVSTTTIAAAIGVSGASNRGLFRYGFALRPNYRIDYQNNSFNTSTIQNTDDFINYVNNNAEKTTSMAMDAGFSITAADYWFPTLGFVIRNIPTGCIDNYVNPINQNTETMCGAIRDGAANSNSTSTPNTSKIDPTDIRVGFSLTPRGKVVNSKVNLRLSVDAYPLPVQIGSNHYGVDGIELSRLMHAGGELFFGNVLTQKGFALRAGYKENGITWGTSLKLTFLTIDYTSYVINDTIPQPNNNSGTPTKIADRRHLLGISYHW